MVHLKIIQPTSVKIDADFDSVLVPGMEGDFEILENHAPFLTKIRPGILTAVNDKNVFRYCIHDGFVSVDNNQVIILSEAVEKDTEIDVERAKQAKERALGRLNHNVQQDIDFRRAETALKRALARLEISK